VPARQTLSRVRDPIRHPPQESLLKRITIEISEDLHRLATQRAEGLGLTLEEFLCRAVEDDLERVCGGEPIFREMTRTTTATCTAATADRSRRDTERTRRDDPLGAPGFGDRPTSSPPR